MEIKVGEYVRTKDKILKIYSFERDLRNVECVCFTTGEVYTKELLNEIIVKHSKNLIDLIEVGDYVNGKRVLEKIGNLFLEVSSSDFGNNRIFDYMIKTILTKEQYQVNCYVVESEEKE